MNRGRRDTNVWLNGFMSFRFVFYRLCLSSCGLWSGRSHQTLLLRAKNAKYDSGRTKRIIQITICRFPFNASIVNGDAYYRRMRRRQWVCRMRIGLEVETTFFNVLFERECCLCIKRLIMIFRRFLSGKHIRFLYLCTERSASECIFNFRVEQKNFLI